MCDDPSAAHPIATTGVRGAQLVQPHGGMLRVNCWCERRIFRIPVEEVGFTTRSCGPHCHRPLPEEDAMPQQDPGRRRVSVNIDLAVAAWADEYARERGIGVEHVYETALMQLRERVTAGE